MTQHPSMDYPSFPRATESVRRLVLATRVANDAKGLRRGLVKAPPKPEFGLKPEKKSRKKKAQHPERGSMIPLARAVLNQELEALEQEARRDLPEENVIYCCGALRIVDRIDFECTCAQNDVYRNVNGCLDLEYK